MGEPLLIRRNGKTRAITIRFRYLFLCAIILGGAFLIFSLNSSIDVSLLHHDAIVSIATNRIERNEADDRFTIQTEGCTIPGLQAFDENILRYIRSPNQPKLCQNANYPLLSSNASHIWINPQNYAFYNISDDMNVTCCYKSFSRPSAVQDVESLRVDDRVQYHPCTNFSNYIKVSNEFVRVSCRCEDKLIYEQFFLFALLKPFRRYGFKDQIKDTSQNESYNVILLGVDGISRLNFYRTMPKTATFLKEKDSIEMLGYNKVGDNTFPNIVPILLGIMESDLKWLCWPHAFTTFDNCPFIWQKFKDAGYYTALGEDVGTLGTFNFEKFGFIKTPTDYYIHTFMHEAEVIVGNNKDFNSYVCMGDTYFYKVLLDYVENLLYALKSFRLFGFFWEVTMSHDYLNYPMTMDDHYEAFFRRLDNSGYLEKSIIILLSDHGIRWGGIRFTKQGRLEERLPLCLMLLPPSFRRKYNLAYENLQRNSRQLTTPFDVHETLIDLVNLTLIENENIHFRPKTEYIKKKGISLFLPVPKNRTCALAYIDDHWCTCKIDRKVSKESDEAREAATNALEELNAIIKPYEQCAQLALNEIVEVTEVTVGTADKDEVGWREFTVVISTVPGGGVFEATLRQTEGRWDLAGTISRLNLYGQQSRCVHHHQIKLYCYCK